MIGELLQTLPNQIINFIDSPTVVEYSAESIVLACVRMTRSSGTRSATIYFETIDSDDEVVETKLFAVRVAPEWSGEIYYLVDQYTQSNISGSSVFSNVCEVRQVSAGDMQGSNFITDDYPVVVGTPTGFYHCRGIEAKCRIAPNAASFVNGVHTIRSPKVAIFRNPTTHTKRYFVRSRANYVANNPANPFLLAPSGDNTVTLAEEVGQYVAGMVYTGDEHPEISLTGSRRTATRTHAERTAIEPFYYMTNLRGGKKIRVTYREIAEGTADPVMTNEYPSDGTARSDEQVLTTSSLQLSCSCTFVPLG
jgi:hypothetical protein